MTQTAEHPWETLKQLSIPMWFFDQRDQRVYLNKTLKDDLSIEVDEIVSHEIPYFLHQDDLETMYQVIATGEHQKSFQLSYRLKGKEGYRLVSDLVTPYYDASGALIGYHGLYASADSCRDELEQLKKSIVEIGKAFSTINGQSFFNFFVGYLADLLGVSTVIIGEVTDHEEEEANVIAMFHKGEVTSGFRYSLKETPCQHVIRTYECFYPKDLPGQFPHNPIFQKLELESYLGKALMNSAGDVIGFLAILDENPQSNEPLSKALFQIFADRMENELSKMKAENQLRLLSQYDSLTGLAQRDYFSGLVKHELEIAERNHQKLALLIIDLDNFKMINDSWGHEKGDELLRQFAQHLKRIFSRRNCILSRVSSDEFIVLLKEVSGAEEACALADYVIQSMKRPFMIDQKEYYSTASAGVALFPHDGTDESAILTNANAAMHKAKRNGKNRYELYDAHMSEELREEMYLKQALHLALEKNEFVLHYQPQICGKTSRVIGYEALARWNQPAYGLLSPHYFIGLAEENGMITRLGEWVLKEACAQLKIWQVEHKRPDLKVSVNISPQQFADRLLPVKIFRALDETDLSPESLIIEITETTILQDFERSAEILNILREKGIHIHLDDFGVGFSSLNYLSRLPVDAIKIDRSFINRIGSGSNDVAIVSAIIAMAKSLDLQIIAEGVERKEHIEYLMNKGCFEYQGYYFSKPKPAEMVVL